MSTNEHDLQDETWDSNPSQFTIDSDQGRFPVRFPNDLVPPDRDGEEEEDLDEDLEEDGDLDDVDEPEEDEPDDDGEDEIGINPFTDEDF